MFENSMAQVIAQVKEAMPKTEVVAKVKRRRFTAAEKQRLLREVDACQGSGGGGRLAASRRDLCLVFDDLA